VCERERETSFGSERKYTKMSDTTPASVGGGEPAAPAAAVAKKGKVVVWADGWYVIMRLRLHTWAHCVGSMMAFALCAWCTRCTCCHAV
jgi:hypothetical protein